MNTAVLVRTPARPFDIAGNYDAYVAGWRFNGKLDLASIFGSKAGRKPTVIGRHVAERARGSRRR